MVDNVAPALQISFPRDQSFVTSFHSITGFVSDIHPDATGLAALSLYLQAFDGRFWNGTSWTEARAPLDPQINRNNWAIHSGLPSVGQLVDGPYTIQAEARDHVGNTNSVTACITVDASRSIALIERLADGRVRVRFPGVPGRTYRVEASVDLITWANLGVVTVGPSGILEVLDANAAAFPHRFYRTVSP